MSRVIKFRIRLQNRKDSSVITIYNDPFDAMCGIAFYPIDRSEWGILSIEQFTMMHDKNGVDIYEGDIVKYKIASGYGADDEIPAKYYEAVMVIEFKDGEFKPRPLESFCDDMFYGYKMYDFEVIGNIHENSQLLEDK